MQEPVTALDGHTYERSAIEDWFKQSRAKKIEVTSPKTGRAIGLHLVPAHAMKVMIDDFSI